MDGHVIQRTLLEDWDERRARLVRSSGRSKPGSDPRVRVLDYLLSRYRDSPLGRRPARPLPPAELYSDDRRILVHHHLARGQVGGVQDATEAEFRVLSVVHRMQSPRDAPSDQEPEQAPEFVKAEPVSARVISIWRAAIKSIGRGRNADREIRSALSMSTFLPSEIIHHLASRLGDTEREDVQALELLRQCQNERISDWIVDAWRLRVLHCPSEDQIRAGLEEYFCRDNRRTAAAEKMREELAHDHVQVRLAALSLLEELGDLDDIGLLADLMSLPSIKTEGGQERDALLRAMQRLAGQSPE